MAEKSKKPAIRFAGFTDAWEQRKVGELFRVTRGYVLAATQTDTTKTDENPYPVYSSQTKDRGLMGYYKDYLYEDAITWTTDGANAGTVNYRVGKFYCTNVCGVLLSNEIKANQMIAEALNNVAKGYVSYVGNPKLMNNIMAEIVIQIPTQTEEREQLSSFFINLDNLITLHQRKYDKLVNVKKAMLEKMFPKDGADVPEIRFKGFTEAWEQCKLGDIVNEYSDPMQTPHDGYVRLGIRSHGKGTFYNYVKPGQELGTAQMHKVAADKLIVNITFAWEHAVAVTDENDVEKLVSHRFPQFSLSEKICPKFLHYLILDGRFRHHLWLSSPGGAGRNRVLKIPEMLEYKMQIPSVDEQRQIAYTLCRLDNLITLHQRKFLNLV
mgnify:CR=1 FL=1